MRFATKKRASENREYSLLRREFLEKNPYCVCCLEDRKYTKATEIHHLFGRIGRLLLYTLFWVPLCPACHRLAEKNEHWINAKIFSAARKENPDFDKDVIHARDILKLPLNNLKIWRTVCKE